jgi:2-phospho-L-lactate transferase/gluconeogenesis factor (CofD/UPF0052 family)
LELPFILFGAVFLFILVGFIVSMVASGGFFALVATVFGRELQRAAAINAANDASPILEKPSKVVGKRTRVSGMENTSTRYYATFEDTNGVRSEFWVSGSEFGQLADGDRGVLRHQGTRFLAFTREITK